MSNLIDCGKCKAHWSGAGRAHCGGCHKTFSGLTAFDAHQRGNTEGQTCGDPTEKGMELREKSWGTYWAYPAPENGFAWATPVANPERTKK